MLKTQLQTSESLAKKKDDEINSYKKEVRFNLSGVQLLLFVKVYFTEESINDSNDFLVSDTDTLGKKCQSSPSRSQAYEFLVTSIDALLLSFRRFLRA